MLKRLIFSFLLLFSLCVNGQVLLKSKEDLGEIKFQHIHAVQQNKKLRVQWALGYEDHAWLKSNGYTISLRYLDKDNFEKKTKKWNVIEDLSINNTSYSLSASTPTTKMYFQVGLAKNGKTKWSCLQTLSIPSTWSWFNLIVLIGSLGLFVHGLKLMGEGLQQTLGAKLRTQISSITTNQFRSIVAGFSIASIVQSIIASVLMIVSFVNAGLLTLTQSAGMMLGAMLGAAVTTWFIHFLTFEVDLSSYALFILAFTAPLLFFGKKRWKPWVNTIFGFVFLILGLVFLMENMPEDLLTFPAIQQTIDLLAIPYLGQFVFVAIGLLFALFLQSTVATIAVAMTLLTSSNLPFEAGLAMLLGANLGAAVNVEIASRSGNVHAKRSARLNSLFTIIGFSWMFLCFPLVVKFIQQIMIQLGWGDPILNAAHVGNSGLAIFHSLLAILNVLLLVWFIPQLKSLVETSIKSKGRSDEVFHLEYINMGLLSTADLSILEAKKEIAKFGNLTQRMSKMVHSLLFEKNAREFEKTLNRIKKYEDITDRIEVEVVQYLNKLSEGDLTLQTASRIHSMNSMVNDLERIGDIFYQMSKNIERKSVEKLWFTPEQRNNLSIMFELVDEALSIMYTNLTDHQEKVNLETADDAERRINEKRNELRKAYFENLSNQDTNFKAGMIYNDLFSSLEKVGDHVINVSEAVVGKV